MAGLDTGDSPLEVFLSAIDVSRKLGRANPDFPRNIWQLMDMVEASLGAISPTGRYDIHAHPRIYEADHIIGTVDAFDTEAHIYYDLNQNTCWRRFVVTKEICHLLFAPHGAKHLASTPAQIEQLITQLLSGLNDAQLFNDHNYGTEHFTVLMAVEVLLPHSERERIEHQLSNNTDRIEIAKYYRLPQAMLALYLSPSFKAWMDIAYKTAGPEQST